MIDDKDALFIKLQYTDFCPEMVEYATQFIHWDQVPNGMNSLHPITIFLDKYYGRGTYDSNVAWRYCHTFKYKSKYPKK
jgi:hypothetical protein